MAVFLVFSGLIPALATAILLWQSGQDLPVVFLAYALSGSLGLLVGAGIMQFIPPGRRG